MADGAPLHTLAARQNAYVIFQTVTRDSTTFLTQVTLGSQPTDAPPPPPTRNHESATGLTDAEIGAVIGAVLGFFLLVLIICCCFFRRRPVKVMKVKSNRNSYSSSYIVDENSPPPPVAPRVMKQEFFYRPMRTPRQPAAAPYQPPASPYRPPPVSTPYQPPSVTTPFRQPATPFQEPQSPVPYPPNAAQCIPGGPKFPTYRALPIPNPRKPANIRRDVK